MNSLDPDTIAEIVNYTQEKRDGEAFPAWLEQSDDRGRVRVLLAVAYEVESGGKRYRIFRVKLAAHTTSPIYYVFQRKGSEDKFATLAYYILSYQYSSHSRKWVCDSTRNTKPFVGTYRGDFGFVGSRFHEASAV